MIRSARSRRTVAHWKATAFLSSKPRCGRDSTQECEEKAVTATPESGTLPRSRNQTQNLERRPRMTASRSTSHEIELRTAKVTCEAVPKSKKLVKLQVDLGTEQRTILAGIAEAISPKHWSANRSSSSPTSTRETDGH